MSCVFCDIISGKVERHVLWLQEQDQRILTSALGCLEELNEPARDD